MPRTRPPTWHRALLWRCYLAVGDVLTNKSGISPPSCRLLERVLSLQNGICTGACPQAWRLPLLRQLSGPLQTPGMPLLRPHGSSSRPAAAGPTERCAAERHVHQLLLQPPSLCSIFYQAGMSSSLPDSHVSRLKLCRQMSKSLSGMLLARHCITCSSLV